MADWEERATRARERFEDGATRLPEGADEGQRQLTRMGNAAWAAGLSLLMLGRRAEADDWLVRAAETYRRSWPDAPPGSWGRPIGAMKARLIAGDLDGGRTDALALLVLEDDAAAAAIVPTLAGAESIPPAVTATLGALAAGDAAGYETAISELVADFEARDEFLEDVPVADTVLALQVLAAERGVVVELTSAVLPE